jgi:DNA-binding NarL/FixJ family response regulator
MCARVLGLHKRTVTSDISPGSIENVAANLPKAVRVLIADDHRLFAQALEAILDTDDRIEIVGHARDGREAVELTKSLKPDVILMDIAMPVMDGFQATKQIMEAAPHARVLMLTGSNSRSDVDRARKSGASGYVTKDRIAGELVDAIFEVSDR